MFDTGQRPLVLLVASLFLVTFSYAADRPALLGDAEQAGIDDALHSLKMTRADLGYKKDYSDAPYRLKKVQRFLEQPLELPKYADNVLKKLGSLDGLTGLPSFLAEQLEWKNVSLEGFDPTVLYVTDDPAMQKVEVLAPVIGSLVSSMQQAQRMLGRAFEKTTVDQRLRAVARYAVENFHLETDLAEVQSLGTRGFSLPIMKEMISSNELLQTEDDEYARDLLPLWDSIDHDAMQLATAALLRAVDKAVNAMRHMNLEGLLSPAEKVRIKTDMGPVIIGGPGPTHYGAEDDDAVLLIDLGGDDFYECGAGAANGLVGRPISILIDLGGNDIYRSGTIAQGAGVFGIGVLVDCGGNDIYEARHLCQGAGLFGVGVHVDWAGNDSYTGDVHSQGAGIFGVGVLWDWGGDDRYFARQSSQGFGYTGGLGLLLDANGNDSYYAGGKYSDHERLPEHFLSCSQGFGYGIRPDASGGIGILCDLAGNDTYVTDIYGQGVSYWYSLGMLLDAQGNDVYHCHQYGQGAGIHLSVGILADWQGDDEYIGHGLVQGTAHDWSVGMLFDKGGNDQYVADSTAQGSALYNSTALLVDSAGNDLYASPKGANTQAAGHDGERREYGTIALLLDLGGKDSYSNGPRDNFVALKPLHGCALDCEASERPSVASAARESSFVHDLAENPPLTRSNALTFASSPTDLSQPRNDRERRWLQLIREATQYEDTEQKAKRKAIAYELLKRESQAVLPFWLRQLDHDAVTVRVRLEEFMDFVGATNSAPALIEALQSPSDKVRRQACYFAGRYKVTSAIPLVREQLSIEKVRAVALWTLGELKDKLAFDAGMKSLGDPEEAVRLRAAGLLGKLGDGRAAPRLIAALDDSLWDVRYAAEFALIKIGKPSVKPMLAALANANDLARPYLVEALGAGNTQVARSLRPYLRSSDPLLRGTAVTAIAHLKPRWWNTERTQMLKMEKDLFVRSRLEGE